VEVYTIDGRKAYTGEASSLNLPSGVYIVRSGAVARKVIIK
jgi:hypothetical protein